MATQNSLIHLTLPAAASFASSQYLFAVVNSSGQWAVAGTAGIRVDGVIQDNPDAAGKPSNGCIGGKTKIQLGGTVAAGAAVTTDANGKAVAATTGNIILGTCIEGGAAGDIGSIIFNPANVSA